jgi:thiamine biosynthesis lipoprotein
VITEWPGSSVAAQATEEIVPRRPAAPTPRDSVRPSYDEIRPTSTTAPSMGGRLTIHLDAQSGRTTRDRHDLGEIDFSRTGSAADACSDSRRLIARVDRWASRLTRHTETSDLSVLNADPLYEVPVRPTLAAALLAGLAAADASRGLADMTLLNARLAAEGLASDARPSGISEVQITRGHRGSAIVRRPPGLRIDLGGVGKGWIADRALKLLHGWLSAIVDADGDLAVRSAPGRVWLIGVDDPRQADADIAVLRLTAAPGGTPTCWGVATSGTSIHRWNVRGDATHHLIDPRTGRPARTDVVQATVVADTALRAEALAKAAVIAGSMAGLALLERAGVRGAVILTTTGEVMASPATLALLAA